jgi:hypothetical protein
MQAVLQQIVVGCASGRGLLVLAALFGERRGIQGYI